ncbi:MAG: EamA family transporter, partial [Limisphaerales bacterium]
MAFAVIYVVWGSTYLAIRVVVETIPPFLSAAVRFLVAGVLLMGLLAMRKVALPNAAQWRHSLVSGLLLSVGGNGLVVWAEQSISSGLAALLVALAPVWFALLEWMRPGGK